MQIARCRLAKGKLISQPYIVAFMTELLNLNGTERVLEIGTGSGYQTAVLGKLAAEVYSIEILPTLSKRAKTLLERLGFDNVHLKVGDGFFGWEEQAPFDAILVTAAAPKIPETLWRQLREGGRLIMPLGADRQLQALGSCHEGGRQTGDRGYYRRCFCAADGRDSEGSPLTVLFLLFFGFG